MDAVDYLFICLVMFVYLYLVLVHEEFVVPQGSCLVRSWLPNFYVFRCKGWEEAEESHRDF
jgi:hypothetical protein